MLCVQQDRTRDCKQYGASSSRCISARRWSTPDTIHTILLTFARVLCPEWWTHCAYFVNSSVRICGFPTVLESPTHRVYLVYCALIPKLPCDCSSVLTLLQTTSNISLSQKTHTHTRIRWVGVRFPSRGQSWRSQCNTYRQRNTEERGWKVTDSLHSKK